jgi:hypothetical protein
MASGGTVSQWVEAHDELAELARRRAELDGVEGSALLRAFRAGVHRHLGFASFAEYVERLFGYSRRTLDDKLRTAEALEGLPALSRSLRERAVSWSTARELARVATVDTEREWIEAARGRSVHEVERLVSGRGRGAHPGESPAAAEQRRVLRFEVNPETFATFREAMKLLRQTANQQLDDDTALLPGASPFGRRGSRCRNRRERGAPTPRRTRCAHATRKLPKRARLAIAEHGSSRPLGFRRAARSAPEPMPVQHTSGKHRGDEGEQCYRDSEPCEGLVLDQCRKRQHDASAAPKCDPQASTSGQALCRRTDADQLGKTSRQHE